MIKFSRTVVFPFPVNNTQPVSSHYVYRYGTHIIEFFIQPPVYRVAITDRQEKVRVEVRLQKQEDIFSIYALFLNATQPVLYIV